MIDVRHSWTGLPQHPMNSCDSPLCLRACGAVAEEVLRCLSRALSDFGREVSEVFGQIAVAASIYVHFNRFESECAYRPTYLAKLKTLNQSTCLETCAIGG